MIIAVVTDRVKINICVCVFIVEYYLGRQNMDQSATRATEAPHSMTQQRQENVQFENESQVGDSSKASVATNSPWTQSFSTPSELGTRLQIDKVCIYNMNTSSMCSTCNIIQMSNSKITRYIIFYFFIVAVR